MAIHIDPVTRQRILFEKHSGDFTYNLVGDKAISEETVPLIGNFEDFTGSGIVNSRTQQMWAGVSNELQGTDPGIMGKKLADLGVVGQNVQTTRRRTIKRLATIKIDKEGRSHVKLQ